MSAHVSKAQIIDRKLGSRVVFLTRLAPTMVNLGIERLHAHSPELRRGYTPMSYQTLDPDTQKAPDNKEGLYFGVEVPPGSEDAGKPLCGPNQWPDAVRCLHCLTEDVLKRARPRLRKESPPGPSAHALRARSAACRVQMHR